MWIEEIGRNLTGRLLEIWEGRSGKDPATEEAYRVQWRIEAARGKGGAGLAPAPFRDTGTPRDIGPPRQCRCGKNPS